MTMRIQEVREQQGISRKELAEACDIPTTSLEHLEKTFPIMLTRIETIAAVLGVDPAYLCDWSTEKRERVMIKEKIVEVPVVERVYLETIRIPEYWKVEDNKIIKWREK